MWYISEVGFVRGEGGYRPGEFVKVPYMYYDLSMRKYMYLHLLLSNTDNDQTVKLRCYNWDEFYKLLKEHNPYGWCPGGYEVGDAMFCSVDRLSLDFLGYVDRVFEVPNPSDKLLQQTRGFLDVFSFWDADKSIVDCSSSFVQHAFPLYQIMCFLKDGWIGDKFYIRGRTGKVFCVEFSDLQRARVMLSKAVVTGYNPVLQYKDDLPHMFRN